MSKLVRKIRIFQCFKVDMEVIIKFGGSLYLSDVVIIVQECGLDKKFYFSCIHAYVDLARNEFLVAVNL